MSKTQVEKPYQVMEPLSDEEYRSLKKKIEENGVEDPIHIDEEPV